MLALVPFAARNTLEPSRFLYLSSAGSSLVLAWFVREGMTGAQRFVSAWFRPVALGVPLFGLIATSIFSLHQAETVAYYSSGRSYDARTGQLESLRLYKKSLPVAPG